MYDRWLGPDPDEFLPPPGAFFFRPNIGDVGPYGGLSFKGGFDGTRPSSPIQYVKPPVSHSAVRATIAKEVLPILQSKGFAHRMSALALKADMFSVRISVR